MSRIEYAIGLGRGRQLDYDSISNSNHLTDARWAAAAAAAAAVWDCWLIDGVQTKMRCQLQHWQLQLLTAIYWT